MAKKNNYHFTAWDDFKYSVAGLTVITAVLLLPLFLLFLLLS